MLTQWLFGGDRGACCSQSTRGVGCDDALAEDVAGEVLSDNQSPLRPASKFPLPAGPRTRMVPSYCVLDAGGVDELGEPLACGDIILVNVGQSIMEMRLTICAKGFILSLRSDLQSHAAFAGDFDDVKVVWSPFTLVERCQVKASQQPEKWVVFKLTLFRSEGRDATYYFASSGADAEAQRTAWVAVIVEALSTVTLSLFPDYDIVVQPVVGKPRTARRIIAGYLFYAVSAEKITLFFCELHAPLAGCAEMVFYTDEYCEDEIFNIMFTSTASASTRKGAYCTVFGLDSHRFAARTRQEKDLWLRAVSNVLVKLMFVEQDTSAGDLAMFRAAVHERLESIPAHRSHEEHWDASAAPPMLCEEPRRPPRGASGDPEDPPEVEEEPLLAEVGRWQELSRPYIPSSDEVGASGPGAELLARCGIAEDTASVHSSELTVVAAARSCGRFHMAADDRQGGDAQSPTSPGLPKSPEKDMAILTECLSSI